MKTWFSTVSAAAVLSPLLIVQPAAAQTAAEPTTERPAGTAVDASGATLSEIIVTARRRNERLQDVPASVSVLTEATLANAGITTTEQAVNLVSGVTIVTNTAEPGDTQINIRGLNGARDAEMNVALVVDGILKTNTSVLNQDQSDLVQFEVLKGPQGAYYGRNAEAGAIVVSTRKPGDTLGVRARATAGNNDSYSGFLSVSGPLAEGVGLLVSGDYRRTDGFFRNDGPIPEAQGATIDQYKGWNLNSRLVAEIGDALNIDAKARYGKVRAGSINFNVVFGLPNFTAINPAFDNDVNTQPWQFLSNIPSDGNQRTIEASLKLDYDLGPATLTAWGSYNNVKQDLLADAAAAAFGFFNSTPECRLGVAALNAAGFQLPAPQVLGQVPESNIFVPNGSLISSFSPTTCDGAEFQRRDQKDGSFEVRLVSNRGGAVEWSVGAYFLNLTREVAVNLSYDRGLGVLRQDYAPPGSINPTEQLSADRFRTRVLATFGSVDWSLTPKLKLSGALRYDSERRKVSNLVDPTLRNQFVLGGNAPLNVGFLNGGTLPDKQRTFEQIQPKVALSYTPTPDWTVFANWGIGFKSGGFNNGGSKAAIDQTYNNAVGSNLLIRDDYDKEVSSAFEAGFKGSLLGGALSIEGAGYLTDIEDMQFFEFFVGNFGILRVVSNIDKVQIRGAELSMRLRANDWLSFYASGNINDSEIKRNRARPNTDGGKSPYTADYTLNFGGEANHPLTEALELLARVDVKVTGPTWFSTAQTGTQPTIFNAILPLAGLPAFLGNSNLSKAQRDSFTIVNARLGIQGERWRLSAFADNLFNARYLDEVIPAPDFGGSFISPGNRRSYGVELGYRF